MSESATAPPFSRFNSLPPELRLMIWHLNLPEARKVKVHYIVQTGKFYSTTPVPANLQICRESRLEASNHWRLHLGTLGHPAQVWANLLLDHIQMDFEPIRLKAVRENALRNIRRLEIGGKELQRIPTERLLSHLLSFLELEHLTIVSPEAERLCLEYFEKQGQLHEVANEQQPAGVGSSASEKVVMSARVRAELDGHRERRAMAFAQHKALTEAMIKWESVNKLWNMPSLWLVTTTASGKRDGPFVWSSETHRRL